MIKNESFLKYIFDFFRKKFKLKIDETFNNNRISKF